MTVQELYPQIKHFPFVIVDFDGTIIPSYDRHKYMYRDVDELGAKNDILYVYLSVEA